MKEILGEFWLPETPDRKASGTLTYTEEQGIRLALIGRVVDAEAPTEPPATVARILGMSTQGEHLTLDNCRRRDSQISFGPGLGAETYDVGFAFNGVHYEPGEVPESDTVSVHLRHVMQWTGVDGLTEKAELLSSHLSLTLKAAAPIAATVTPGVKLTLSHGIGIGGPRTHRALTQSARVSLKFDAPVPYVDATRYVTNLQDLVSIATDRVAEIDQFSLTATAKAQDPDGNAVVLPVVVDMLVDWIAHEHSDRTVHPSNVPIPFDAIGGLAGVVTWLQTTKDIQPLISRVMATRYQRNMYADDRFFNRAAVLDGLHRRVIPQSVTPQPTRRSRRPSTRQPRVRYTDRLKALADMAGVPFTNLVADVDRWRAKVVEERDDHAHHLGNAANTTGATRLFLAESAYWLFVLVLLRRCGYPQAVFDAVEQYEGFDFTRRNLVGII
jgi:hypothetical protein